MTLTEFLTARLDEDQRVAEAAGAGSEGWELSAVQPDSSSIQEAGIDWRVIVYDEGAPTRAESEHIVAWQPSRVLAEIAAKRTRITYLAELASRCPEDDWPTSGGMEQAPMADLARWLLKVEAQPYRDRAGWDASWEVEG